MGAEQVRWHVFNVLKHMFVKTREAKYSNINYPNGLFMIAAPMHLGRLRFRF